ncbi:STAS domain-containing protein [Gramella sp. MAR_2010_147]|uniref:STAS domain-containing protein n=1 Tax=Gramella sp. MAR_2010_147 TaxID=1250205 RepID=UPI00087C3745|nr:STAS domain-containing protein [Gramella sp. MAR_2010_147]SDR77055.1 anti-anti-sigma factor [Gramella sp. MAR_2010_147]
MLENENNDVIRLRGRLDEKNVSEVEKQLQEILKSKENLILDLNDLEVLDVSGIFMLFVLKQKAKNQRKDVTFLLENSKVISGNILGISIPKII